MTTIIISSDWHLGNANTDIGAIKNMLSDVRRNGWGLIVPGDIGESVVAGDKRFHMETVAPEFLGDSMVGKQYKLAEKLLKPVASQTLMLMAGNHDNTIAKRCHIDMVADMAERLEIEYSPYSAMSRLTYIRSGKKFSYKLFTTHGHGAGQTTGGRINTVEKLAISYEADAFFMGHSHGLSISSRVKKCMTKENHLIDKVQFFANTGSMLRSIVEDQVSYAEFAGYAPLKVGYIKATFNPREYGIKLEEVVV